MQLLINNRQETFLAYQISTNHRIYVLGKLSRMLFTQKEAIYSVSYGTYVLIPFQTSLG